MKTKYEKLGTSDPSLNTDELIKYSLVNSCMIDGIESQCESDGFIPCDQTFKKGSKSTTSSTCMSSKHSASDQNADGKNGRTRSTEILKAPRKNAESGHKETKPIMKTNSKQSSAKGKNVLPLYFPSILPHPGVLFHWRR